MELRIAGWLTPTDMCLEAEQRTAGRKNYTTRCDPQCRTCALAATRRTIAVEHTKPLVGHLWETASVHEASGTDALQFSPAKPFPLVGPPLRWTSQRRLPENMVAD